MPRGHPKTKAIQVARPSSLAEIKQPPSFLSTMKEGFSFGVGSAIAHRVVGGLLNQGTQTQAQSQAQIQSQPERNIAYEQCMLDNFDHVSNASICERYLTKAKENDWQNN